jgi:hypothetical protein
MSMDKRNPHAAHCQTQPERASGELPRIAYRLPVCDTHTNVGLLKRLVVPRVARSPFALVLLTGFRVASVAFP